MTATASSFQVTVTVTDNNDGTLDVAVTYPDGANGVLAFANSYNTNEVSVAFAGAKKIDAGEWVDGPSLEDIAGAFTFTLSGVDEEGNPAPVPDNATATNDASGQHRVFAHHLHARQRVRRRGPG